FVGKTILDEFSDGKVFSEWAIQRFEEKHGAMELESILAPIFLIGFSLGGLIASSVARNVSAKALLLCGSALGFNLEENTPILGSKFLPEGEIQKVVQPLFSQVKGDVILIRGTEDDVASEEKSQLLLSLFSSAKSKRF